MGGEADRQTDSCIIQGLWPPAIFSNILLNRDFEPGGEGENGKAEMQAIGAGALNQAVKAIAIARGFVAPSGVDLVCIPAFAEVEVEGEDRTGIKLIVESRK